MNYQGYLTDSSGTPLNGTYNLAFRLYDAVSGGTLEWGTEVHNNTQVTNGIFQVTLGSSVDLYASDFDEALFLAVRVNGTWVSPRQPLHAVPYAFGLVPGAQMWGDPESTYYGLEVVNSGTGPYDRGIYARGNQYGIYARGNTYGLYARETGSGNVAIKAAQFVEAQGYKSTDDSYWWYDANRMVTEDTISASGSFAIRNYFGGGVELDCSSTGADFFVLPLDVPGVLLGQDVGIEEARVYYRTTNSATYIDRTFMRKSTGAGSGDWTPVGEDTTDRTSTSASSYPIDIVSGSHTLTSGSGNILILFDLECGNTAHDLFISGVRLRLTHTD